MVAQPLKTPVSFNILLHSSGHMEVCKERKPKTETQVLKLYKRLCVNNFLPPLMQHLSPLRPPFKAILISACSVQTSKCSWLPLLIIVAAPPLINISAAKCTFSCRMSASALNGLPSMSSFLWTAPDARMSHHQTRQYHNQCLINESQRSDFCKELTQPCAANGVSNGASFTTSVTRWSGSLRSGTVCDGAVLHGGIRGCDFLRWRLESCDGTGNVALPTSAAAGDAMAYVSAQWEPCGAWMLY